MSEWPAFPMSIGRMDYQKFRTWGKLKQGLRGKIWNLQKSLLLVKGSPRHVAFLETWNPQKSGLLVKGSPRHVAFLETWNLHKSGLLVKGSPRHVAFLETWNLQKSGLVVKGSPRHVAFLETSWLQVDCQETCRQGNKSIMKEAPGKLDSQWLDF